MSENIWMPPDFTDDGQVCMMRLYPKRISATTNYLSETLDNGELKEVLAQLAPPETRGKRAKPFGLILLLGQMSETVFGYENVSITFLAPLHLKPTQGVGPESPAAEKARDKSAEESDEEMAIPRTAEIATIRWTGRACAKK